MRSFWFNGGKIAARNGVPVLCSNCPCPTEESSSSSSSSERELILRGCCGTTTGFGGEPAWVPQTIYLDLGDGGWTNVNCGFCTSIRGHYALTNCSGIHDGVDNGEICDWRYFEINIGSISWIDGNGHLAGDWLALYIRLAYYNRKWNLQLATKADGSTMPFDPNTPFPPERWGDGCGCVTSEWDWVNYESAVFGPPCWTGEPIPLTKIVSRSPFFPYDLISDTHINSPAQACGGHLPDAITIY